MTPIPAAVAKMIATPAPVLIIDTCNFLDLFRRDSPRQQPRVPPAEIEAAAEIIQLVTARPDSVHLVVPELVPGEYADHAHRIEREFEGWFRFHDENQDWLANATPWIGLTLPAPSPVQPFAIQASCRRLADDLLAKTIVLERDQVCLDRAVSRLIAKRRPSHKKEMKDSMNLEQSLELSRQLQEAEFTFARVFVSSNTNDFAEGPTSAVVHPDIETEFVASGLEYFTSLRAALRSLRAKAQLP